LVYLSKSDASSKSGVESGWHFLWLSLTQQTKLQKALNHYSLETEMLALVPNNFVL